MLCFTDASFLRIQPSLTPANLYLPSVSSLHIHPSGAGAGGLQRCQGARSLRDRQLPTALPALDRTSTRRHGANNRPKGHSRPSACKITCCGKASSGFDSGWWYVLRIIIMKWSTIPSCFLPGKESRCAIMCRLEKKWSTGRLLEALKTADGWNILLVFDGLCSTNMGSNPS